MSEPENITPAHLRCSVGGCSSIHRLEDGKGLLIVGKDPLTVKGFELPEGVSLSIGRDEHAVLISEDLLADLKAEWVREAHDALSAALREARSMLRACELTEPDDADLRQSWDRGLAKIDALLSRAPGEPA